MTPLFLGLYGLYVVLVAAQGNANQLLALMVRDAPRYLPWLLAIIALAVMSEFDATREIVKPFIALVVLNFFLSNFDAVKSEVSKIYAMTGV